MKSKTMILMGIAIVCGLVASYMTSKLLAEREQQPQETEVVIEKVKVLVAKQNIPYGTFFNEPDKYFQEKLYTKGEQPSKALANFDEIKGKYACRAMGAEQHVTRDDLMDKEAMGIVGMLPPGMRAVAIPVNAQALAGGFVLPRSRVDIICTIRGEESKIILQDMLILAIDTNETKADGQRAILGGTATIQVDPDQAELVSYAKAIGELSLLPRGLNDHVIVKTPGKGKAQIYATADPKKPDGEDGEEPGDAAGGTAGGTARPKPGSRRTVAARGIGNPRDAKVEDEKPEDDTTTFVQTICNGSEVTKTAFKFDKDGKVIENEDAAVPAPAAPAAPAPARKSESPALRLDTAPKPEAPKVADKEEKTQKIGAALEQDNQPPAKPKSARFHQPSGS